MSKLRELDAAGAIDAREGMGVDQLVRSRLQYLAAQDRSLIAQIQFADAKAAAMITLLGLVLIEAWRPGPDPAPAAAGLVALSSAFFHVAAAIGLGLCLWAVIPRYPSDEDRQASALSERYSWPALAADPEGGDDYAAFMRASQPSHLVASLAQSNHALAQILARKFQTLRTAYLFGAAALALALLREVAARLG